MIEDNKQNRENLPADKNQEKAEHVVRSIFSKKASPKAIPSILKARQRPASSTARVRERFSLSFPKVHWAFINSLRRRYKSELSLGIELESQGVKIVYLTSSQDKTEILNVFYGKVKATDPKLSSKEQRKAVINLLSNIVKEHALDQLNAQVFLSIHSAEVQVKNLILEPTKALTDISQAIPESLQQTLEENLDRLAFDYHVLGPEKNKQKRDVDLLIAVADKEEISDYIDVCESLGLKLQAIETDTLSIIRSLRYNEIISPKEIVVLLDIEEETTKFCMIINNELRFVRNIGISAQELTTAIQKYNSISYEEAEKLKIEYGLLDTSLDQLKVQQIKNAISSSIERLVRDINHSFKFYCYQVAKSKVSKFDKIVLTGESAGVIHKTAYLGNYLKVPVVFHDPLKNIQVSDKSTPPTTDPKRLGARFMIAIGAALRGFEQKRHPQEHSLNLLPAQYRQRQHAFPLRYLNIFIGAAVLVFLLFARQFTVISHHKLRLAQVKKDIEGLQIKLRESHLALDNISGLTGNLENEKKGLQQKLDSLGKFSHQDISVSFMLTYLTELVPEEIWLNKISFENDQIIVSGTTINNDLIGSFMAALDQSIYFRKTVFNYTQRAKEEETGLINFEIKTQLKP